MPVLSHSYAHFQPAAGPLYIAGIAGSGTAAYFADQHGTPRLLLSSDEEGLFGNSGRWNGGDWQATFDDYVATRAAQGFTAIAAWPFWATNYGGIYDNGAMWDGTLPWVSGGDPSTGLNETFWARFDYLITAAVGAGLAVMVNACGGSWDMEQAGHALTGKTSTQYTDYGADLAARYKDQPGIIWVLGDDYFGNEDTQLAAWVTGLRGGGDAHVLTVHNYPESTSRRDLYDNSSLTLGAAQAQFSFIYSYNVSYFGVEQAWLEASPLIPVYGDGYFYQGGATYASVHDRAMRQYAWWALTSGARGWKIGDDGEFAWDSGAAQAVHDNWFAANNAGLIRDLVESLPGWHQLVPDTSSLFVTAGRGTRAVSLVSGGSATAYGTATTDAWVTASVTPDGGLGLIYMSHAGTITIDESKMAAGYTARRADPVTCAETAVSTGTTYNSGAWGNNSRGDPDWVLVLQAP